MSWGYIADLRLSVPVAAWAELQTRRLDDVVLAPGWSGLHDAELEHAFGAGTQGKDTFAKVLAWKCYHAPDTIYRAEVAGDRVALRVCLLLDKSLLDLAQPLAKTFEAARAIGGRGTLTLVNDGTSDGEEGVTLTLEDGSVRHEKLEECWELVSQLGEELFAPKEGAAPEPAKASGKKVRAATGAAKKATGKKKTTRA